VYTVLDLFSGCGGLSLGLEQAGFKIKLGIDSWQDAVNTFKDNHKDSQAHCADLSTVDFGSIEQKYLSHGVDLIVGGHTPCVNGTIRMRLFVLWVGSNEQRLTAHIKMAEPVLDFCGLGATDDAWMPTGAS